MARRVRIEKTGYHHIYNRGLERRVVFLESSDKEKFLDIVCEVAKHYDFVIHGYALMDNHYHLKTNEKTSHTVCAKSMLRMHNILTKNIIV